MRRRWVGAGLRGGGGPLFFCPENPGEPNRAEAAGESFVHGAQRLAVLVGFPPSLERTILDVIRPHGLVVTTVSMPDLVAPQPSSTPQLVVVSGRCGTLSVLELIERLGKPRSTRVVVLLHGPDAEIERAYRAAGITMVLTMPVGLHALLAAGRLEGE